MAAIVEVRSVVTTFGDKVIHDGINLSIERGKITAIIGGSGSGKSVLLREILGLLKPTEGNIIVDGRSLWDLPAPVLAQLRSRIGVLFQGGALLSALSVHENVAAPLREWLQVKDPLLSSIVEGRILLSGLPRDAATKMPSELSGGMVKRAALARALALEPDVLFLDEPTSGLDPVTARGFDILIRTLCDSLGLTICMITHDLACLSSIVDKIIVLGDGRVLTTGSYDDIRQFDHPWIRAYFEGH